MSSQLSFCQSYYLLIHTYTYECMYARVPNVLWCMFGETTPIIETTCFVEEKLTSDPGGFSGGRDDVFTDKDHQPYLFEPKPK